MSLLIKIESYECRISSEQKFAMNFKIQAAVTSLKINKI